LVDNEIKGYGYNLTIWIRNAYHEDCGDAELNQKRKSNSETEIQNENIRTVMRGLNGCRKNCSECKEEQKLDWQELGEKIKNNHPLESLRRSQEKILELNKKK
jgi:hypothetical protein